MSFLSDLVDIVDNTASIVTKPVKTITGAIKDVTRYLEKKK